MKKIALRYGLYSSLVLVGLFLMSYFIFERDNYAVKEVVGYSSIVISMLFVFFGIRHYRDQLNGGMLSFGKGMKVGMLIVLLPSIAFGLFNVFYVWVMDPGFVERYYGLEIASLQKTLPAAEFEAARTRIENEIEMFSNPAVQFLAMGLTVFIIGVIVTVISSLILKRARA